MERLKDKVAVITQAGSYFGRAVAEAYADKFRHFGGEIFSDNEVKKIAKIQNGFPLIFAKRRNS